MKTEGEASGKASGLVTCGNRSAYVSRLTTHACKLHTPLFESALGTTAAAHLAMINLTLAYIAISNLQEI